MGGNETQVHTRPSLIELPLELENSEPGLGTCYRKLHAIDHKLSQRLHLIIQPTKTSERNSRLLTEMQCCTDGVGNMNSTACLCIRV